MHEMIEDLTESDQQIGFVNRQLIQLENELADTKLRFEWNRTNCTCLEELERVQQWPKIRQQLAEAKAYVSLGGTTS